ncbi:MAG: hypothetical protein KJ725_03180 [Gammaproteobacteria bacterium]|uniref:hypothetical protein n=1 Tax=Methylotuvimicrobium sp. TaxID=2822413 RepID=UPI000F653261|nr:hypothetical protein [Gammaproteobacteria bacterium]
MRDKKILFNPVTNLHKARCFGHYCESKRTEAGAVARLTGVGGREPPPSLHGRIYGVLSGE